METPEQEVLGYLREHEHSLTEFLRRLALAESPSTRPESQEEVLGILYQALTELGFVARRIPGLGSGGHLYARPGGCHAPVQLLVGHCDTVWPLGTLKEMPVEIEDGVVKGPGVYDMKGGLAQMVFALQALRELGLEPTVTPIVFVNSDEEIGSRESTRHIRRLSRLVERAFVMEPSLGPSGKLKTARKGGAFLHRGRRAARARWPGPGRRVQRNTGTLVSDPGPLRPQRTCPRNHGERGYHRRGPEPERSRPGEPRGGGRAGTYWRGRPPGAGEHPRSAAGNAGREVADKGRYRPASHGAHPPQPEALGDGTEVGSKARSGSRGMHGRRGLGREHHEPLYRHPGRARCRRRRCPRPPRVRLHG